MPNLAGDVKFLSLCNLLNQEEVAYFEVDES